MTVPVLIEFTHRIWATVVTIFVVVTMILAWRKYKWPSTITALATSTFVLVVVQVLLGMVTVESGTEPIVVTAHLALATLVFASALAASVISIVRSARTLT